MSTDVYLDFARENLDDEETTRVGHLSPMKYYGPLLDEFSMTSVIHPIITEDVINTLAGYSAVYGLYLKACLDLSEDEFIEIFGDSKYALSENFWDWPDEIFIRDELPKFIGMKWRVRVD